MKQTSKLLLVLAELLFLCSLLLPALENIVLSRAVIWQGWRAIAAAVCMLSDAARDPSLLLLGAAGLGNAVFLIAPWLLLFGKPSGASLRVLVGAIIAALFLALWAPHSSMAGSPKLLMGYFSWLLAYAVLLGSVVLILSNKELLDSDRGAYA
jgi:hypothetical protein